MLVYDNDGNSVLASKADASYKRYIGNGAPTSFLSWNNTFRYKKWDLGFQFRGAFGFDIFNMRRYGMGNQLCGTDNVLRDAYLKYKDVKSGGGVISSYYLEKGDYMKLENATLGYTFSPKNLFTITGYKGNDPSVVTSTGITPGVDSNSAYPSATQVSLGVTVRFH